MLEKQLEMKSDTTAWQKAIVDFLRNNNPKKFIEENRESFFINILIACFKIFMNETSSK